MPQYKEYTDISVNEAEIRRYAHMIQGRNREEDDSENEYLEKTLKKCIEKSLKECVYRICYAVYPIKKNGSCRTLDLQFVRIDSEDLWKNLEGCDRVVVFAATVGTGMDRLVVKAGKVSPGEALLYQAIGAERVESLCDRFCEDLEEVYGTLRPRFSPGYGDLSLELQKPIFEALDCSRKIGLTLNDSLLMSPMKSVTAFVGIPKKSFEAKKNVE